DRAVSQLGRVVLGFEIRWQGWWRLLFPSSARCSIVRKRSACRSQFVDHIYIFPGGMKSEMARAGGRLEFGKRQIIRRERAMCRVEVIYEQFVEPQVRGDSEAIVVGEFNLVCVRALLALRIVAPALT